MIMVDLKYVGSSEKHKNSSSVKCFVHQGQRQEECKNRKRIRVKDKRDAKIESASGPKTRGMQK